MHHIINLSPDQEKIFNNSARYLGTSVDKVLQEVLDDYLEMVKNKALN